jgi:endonuclease YncB( thermonuclease family)
MAQMWAWSVPVAGLLLAAGLSDSAFREDRALLRIAANQLEGPVPAEVIRVLDGDTLEVEARIWLGQTVSVRVRIDGVDTPELRGACPKERQDAMTARAWLEQRLAGAEIQLRELAYDKYGGRVLARVIDKDGDVGEALVGAGLARPYAGGAREPWCGR